MPEIEIPPGVVHKPTKASNSSNWRETNLMRWVDGQLTPIRGWETFGYSAFASRVRAVHEWVANDGTLLVAYLCEGHLYVDIAGTRSDVSPTVPIVLPYAGSVFIGGYGDDFYSFGDYGTPRPDQDRSRTITPSYTIDNWGEDLLVMTSADGRLLRWSPSAPATPAAAVTNAPTNNRTFVVTPERFVVLFGAGGDFRRLLWCDQEDIENWTIAATTTKAGDFFIEPSAPLITAKAGKDGVLFFSTKRAYILRFIGAPYYYNYEEVSEAVIPISSASIEGTTVGSFIWATESGFWSYNGSSIIPVDCPVWSWVIDDIDSLYTRYEAASVHISTLSEYWWFFPAEGERYNTKVVIYNYKEGWWSMGLLSRSCGVSSSYSTYPIMSDGYKVYRHESSSFYPDVEEYPWAKTFNINMKGDVITTIRQMMPDVEGDTTSLGFVFEMSMTRNQKEPQRISPRKMMRSDGWLDVGLTARDFSLKVEAIGPQVEPWTLGNSIIDLTNRGKR